MRLVADVGGTNTRLALSDAGTIVPGSSQSYLNDNWGGLYAVIASYLSDTADARPSEMVVAVAGPVSGDRARLTNRNWTIETDILIRDFGCERAELLNDLTALGYAVPVLRADQLKTISKGKPKQTGLAQSLVIGIGTGFNVSPVLEKSGSVYCPAVEAGHISLPLSVARMLADMPVPFAHFTTIEALFSGRGFIAFCSMLTGHTTLTGPEVIAAYGTESARNITEAVDLYSGLLGHLLRDLSLAYMPSSGIYLAGSIARSLMATSPDHCIDVLRQPSDITASFNPAIRVIEDDAAALLGCSGYAFD